MVLLGACTSLGPLSLNLYLPSIPAVQAHFGATVPEVQTTVSLALLAFGLGLVLLGPLTDRYGRRPCLIGGLILFIAGSALAALVSSLQGLAFARVLQSIGCAIAFISARAMVSDVSPREDLPRSVAQITMIMLVVQMVAPLLGNLIMTAGGWRGIQFFGAALSVSLLAGVALAQPETLPTLHRTEQGRSLAEFLRPTITVLLRPGFLVLLLQAGLLYSAYPAFLSIAPHLMVEAFGRPPTEFAYYFVFLPAGYFAGNAFVLKYGSRFGQNRLVAAGAMFAAGSGCVKHPADCARCAAPAGSIHPCRGDAEPGPRTGAADGVGPRGDAIQPPCWQRLGPCRLRAAGDGSRFRAVVGFVQC